MLIYILVVAIILLFRYTLQRMPSGTTRNIVEMRYFRVVCLILIILAALRGSTVGTDTIAYIENYDTMPDLSFREVLYWAADFPGYYLLAKTCSFLHFPIQLLFGIVESIYIYAIYKFINRYSCDKLYSLLCFTMIGLYSFSLAGLKQTLSMAFVIFYYLALTDKKYIRAIIFALVAFYCHHSSLIFLFGVVFFFLRKQRLFYVYLSLFALFVLFGTRSIWGDMLSLLGNDHYSELYWEDEGYTTTTMLFYSVCLASIILFGRNYLRNNAIESRIFMAMSILAVVFQAFANVSSAAFRLSLFFLPFMIVAFPNCFNCVGDPNLRKLVKFGVGFMIVFFFIYSNRNGGSVVPYKFFWEQTIK